MKPGRHTIHDFFVNRYIEQVIVPEIQRDYVWQEEQVNALLDSIYHDYQNFLDQHKNNHLIPQEVMIDEEIRKDFQTFYTARKYSTNIGFIYAYTDQQSAGKYYLIDGQQRMTTIYLTLLLLAFKNEELTNTFEVRYSGKFNYKVREQAAKFLQQLEKHALGHKSVEGINNQSWYYPHIYDHDLTVKTMLSNSSYINSFITSRIEDVKGFFNYMENQVWFWYFDTHMSKQGEELYIYMNARGEQVAPHENIKAALLSDLDNSEKNLFGAKWETWQDFFWQHRGGNENADHGFNEFLRWVILLEFFDRWEIKKESINARQLNSPLHTEAGINETTFLTLTNIEAALDAFKTLLSFENEFNASIPEESSKNKHKRLTLDLSLSAQKGNYAQIDLFRILPALHYIKKRQKEGKDIESRHIIRLLRYLSCRSLSKTVQKTVETTIPAAFVLVNAIDESGDIASIMKSEVKISETLLNAEEKRKLKRFFRWKSAKRIKWEDSFWVAEVFEENNGEIKHLISLSLKIARSTRSSLTPKLFNSVFEAYKSLYKSETDIWGDMLDTSMFVHEGRRVWCYEEWHNHIALLDLTEDFYYSNEETLSQFLESREKAFIQNYTSAQEIKSEHCPKKQLRLYFILTRIEKLKWQWEEKWNFGLYSADEFENIASSEMPKTLFDKAYFFERFNAQWRYNVGYQNKNGLTIQQNIESGRNYFQEMIDWANS